MKKPLLFVLPLLMLASCTSTSSTSVVDSSSSLSTSSPSTSDSSSSSSSSSSAPLVPLEKSEETLLTNLRAFKEASMTSYTLSYREYVDNFMTGVVSSNYLTTQEVHSYVGAFDVQITTEQLEGVFDTSVTETETGYMASKIIDDSTYVAYYIDDQKTSENWINYLENNPYNNPSAYEKSNYESVVDSMITTFEDPESNYPPEYSFVIEDLTIDETETSYIYRIGAYAPPMPEMGYVSYEEGSMEVELDKYTGEIIKLTSVNFLFDGDKTDDREKDAHQYRVSEIKDIVYGEKQEGFIPDADASIVPEENIDDYRKSIITLPEGDLSEEVTISLIDNLSAYMTDCVTDTVNLSGSSYLDYVTWEDLGSYTATGVTTAYNNYFLDRTLTYNFTSGLIATTHIQNEAEEDGIHTYTDTGAEITEYVTSGMNVLSMHDYFTPGPLNADASTIEIIFSELVAGGFVTEDNGFSIITRELIESTNIDGTFKIVFTSSSKFDTEYYKLNSVNTITIEGTQDKVTKLSIANVTDDNGVESETYEEHNLSYGTKTDYTGEYLKDQM